MDEPGAAGAEVRIRAIFRGLCAVLCEMRAIFSIYVRFSTICVRYFENTFEFPIKPSLRGRVCVVF